MQEVEVSGIGDGITTTEEVAAGADDANNSQTAFLLHSVPHTGSAGGHVNGGGHRLAGILHNSVIAAEVEAGVSLVGCRDGRANERCNDSALHFT